MTPRTITCTHCGERFVSRDKCTAGATMCPECGHQVEVATTNR